MSEFPEWAQSRLADHGPQVSHGLNLVLELDPAPNRLPLMLWDIVRTQGKIKQALADLSFVHYARFVPSWDGRALMVTTDFDGPLDPYVLDFVIALGDVFDILLSYVKEPLALPVREHPDEFLAWVRKWNRVPFYLRSPATMFPDGYDYPLYSAYPGKTVTDIVGPRLQLPPPAIDHPAALVDWADVQGNILKGYRAKHGRYLLFSVADAAVARRWLAGPLLDPSAPWGGVANAADWTGGTPPVLTQVALSHEGLAALLPPGRAEELDSFPSAFVEGAAARAWDNFDRGDSRPEAWLFGGATLPVHVVLFVYSTLDAEPPQFSAAVQALEQGQAHGLNHLRSFTGEWLGGTEYFGFADGLSDPAISGKCPAARLQGEPRQQPSASPGEFVLHKDYVSIYGGSSLGDMPEALASNGSFGVLRLMEQDVATFNQATHDEALRLGIDDELLRAKLVGRWKDGTPMAISPQAPTGQDTNSFDYAPSWEFPAQENDHHGLRCPVGAHVRRANPRTARVAGQRHSRRLLRRGMPTRWTGNDGQTKVGLMGLFMGANIEQQFEFIQRQWLQGDLAASGIRGTVDPIASVRETDTEFPFLLSVAAGNTQRLVARIPPLIKTRGCLYLFFPGLAALRALDRPAAAPPPALIPVLAPLKAPALPPKTAPTGVVDSVVSGTKSVMGKVVDAVGGAIGSLFSSGSEAAANAAKVAAPIAAPVLAPVAGAAEVFKSHLPQVKVEAYVDIPSAFSKQIEVEPLRELADGNWREIAQDFTEFKLGSKWVKQLLDSFAPPVEDLAPPAGVDVFDADIADPRFVVDGHAQLQQLRAAGKRIVWVPGQQACWVLTAADCTELFRRKDDFVQAPAGTQLRGIVTLDDPRHADVREAYMAAFQTALGRVEPADIDGIVHGAIAALDKQPAQFDFIQAYALPVARRIVWRFIGIDDPEDQRRCDQHAEAIALSYGKFVGAGSDKRIVSADAALRLAGHLAGPLSKAWLLSSLPHAPYKGTLIGELAARIRPGLPSPHPRPLHFLEALVTLLQTVLASHSPHFLLGTATHHLLSPDPRPAKGGATPWTQLAALRHQKADFDAGIKLALDEARRFEPPIALVERYAKGAQQICGVQLPDGCAVFAMLASANREEAAFGPLAAEFHHDRAVAAGHLSMGYGVHECAGKALQARILPAALGGIIAALPDLSLSNPAAVPPWHATIYFRVLQALTVTRCPP